jgi:hypothetical protein
MPKRNWSGTFSTYPTTHSAVPGSGTPYTRLPRGAGSVARANLAIPFGYPERLKARTTTSMSDSFGARLLRPHGKGTGHHASRATTAATRFPSASPLVSMAWSAARRLASSVASRAHWAWAAALLVLSPYSYAHANPGREAPAPTQAAPTEPISTPIATISPKVATKANLRSNHRSRPVRSESSHGCTRGDLTGNPNRLQPATTGTAPAYAANRLDQAYHPHRSARTFGSNPSK